MLHTAAIGASDDEIAKAFEEQCSEESKSIWHRKYVLRNPRDPGTQTENIAGALKRVARSIADVERRYGADDGTADELYMRYLTAMARREVLPAGRTLANAGSPYTLCVPNCVVLHIEDSLHSIMNTQTDGALLQQAGAGVGYPFHRLRPVGEPVKKSASYSSGPVSFLKVFDYMFGMIKQQNRHGANMAVMRVDHPDVLEFIRCKHTEGNISRFNISVGITDEFMRQVTDPAYHNTPWVCRFDGKGYHVRDIKRDGYRYEITETDMSAKELFDIIVDSAYRNGEPGVVFLDTVNEKNPLPGLGAIECCNPCGEQFLHDGDVCNLGHVNLAAHVTDTGQLDEDKLRRSVHTLTRMLDNVVDLNVDALETVGVERVKNAIRGNRRLGLGFMGLADMLYVMRIRYGSEEACALSSRIMRLVNEACEEQSKWLGVARGSFPNIEHSVFADDAVPRRNAANTSVAPTGTTALAFDVNNGIEPYFSLKYYRHVGVYPNVKVMPCINSLFLAACKKIGHDENSPLVQAALESGSASGVPKRLRTKAFDEIARVFVVTDDLTPEEHLGMQAAVQEHCDNAISKTVNFPNSATREHMRSVYVQAHILKCKGCTVYRDGSRFVQVLNKTSKKEASSSSSGDDSADADSNACPDCDSSDVIYQEGCRQCRACAWSACDTPKRGALVTD